VEGALFKKKGKREKEEKVPGVLKNSLKEGLVRRVASRIQGEETNRILAGKKNPRTKPLGGGGGGEFGNTHIRKGSKGEGEHFLLTKTLQGGALGGKEMKNSGRKPHPPALRGQGV